MIRPLDKAQLSHSIFVNKSEPKISYDPRTRRYAVSPEQNWFEEIEVQGPLQLAYSAKSGKREFLRTISTSGEISREQYQQYLTINPVHLMSTKEFQYLWVDNGFYEADGDLTFEQAVALVRASAIKRARKIQRAVEMSQVQSRLGNVRQDRESIPDEVKHLVWNRDGGHCANCGASSDLQYDHVIPLALGGSNSLSNLQLLCGTCNRRKGPSLTVDHLPSQLLGRKNHVPLAKESPNARSEIVTSFIPGPSYSVSPRNQVPPTAAVKGVRTHQFANTKVQELVDFLVSQLESFRNLRRSLDKKARDLVQFLNSFEGVKCTIDGGYPETLTGMLRLSIEDDRVQQEVEELLRAWIGCFQETNSVWVGISSRFNSIVSRQELLQESIHSISAISDAGSKVTQWVRILNELVEMTELFDRLLADPNLAKTTLRLQGLDERIRRRCNKKLEKAKTTATETSGKVGIAIGSLPEIKDEASQPGKTDAGSVSTMKCEMCSVNLRFDSADSRIRCPQCSSIYAKCERCGKFSTAGNRDPTWNIICENCNMGVPREMLLESSEVIASVGESELPKQSSAPDGPNRTTRKHGLGGSHRW